MDKKTEIIELIKEAKYFEDLFDIPWKLQKKNSLKKADTKGLRIGLFNIPCGGFGDVIVCQTFSEYLRSWYPNATVTVCTTTPEKFKSLGINVNKGFATLVSKASDECAEFDQVRFKGKKPIFDMMIIVPIINKTFQIKRFQKLIPYANVFNSFPMSEYNGLFYPYTFPIGVGEENLGIFLTNPKLKKHSYVKGPYALVYIQPSPQWGIHSKYCFIAYMEMISKKYSQKHKNFSLIIPEWIEEELFGNPQFKHQFKEKVHKYYPKVEIVPSGKVEEKESVKEFFFDESEKIRGKNKTNVLTIRCDILPKPRPEFMSIIKYSVEDVLLTGDQSITDAFSCCSNKRIWYQIAPWKEDFAHNMSKEIPDVNFKTFKSSCGTLRSLHSKTDYKPFLKEYDFRIKGKKRTDAVIQSILHNKDPVIQDYMKIVQSSRYMDTVQAKFEKVSK